MSVRSRLSFIRSAIKYALKLYHSVAVAAAIISIVSLRYQSKIFSFSLGLFCSVLSYTNSFIVKRSSLLGAISTEQCKVIV